jgi:hypothetical protein
MKPKEPGSDPTVRPDDFQRQAEESPPGIVSEVIDFVLHNKKWWMIPIVVALLALGLLSLLVGTGAAPFIYALF